MIDGAAVASRISDVLVALHYYLVVCSRLEHLLVTLKADDYDFICWNVRACPNNTHSAQASRLGLRRVEQTFHDPDAFG